jgi:DNA-directed RNA polymerase subunit M/transcription elongation factor TFIIS
MRLNVVDAILAMKVNTAWALDAESLIYVESLRSPIPKECYCDLIFGLLSKLACNAPHVSTFDANTITSRHWVELCKGTPIAALVDLQTKANETRHDIESAGIIQCGACKSNSVSVVLKQTRSADEGMTAFASCGNCGARWILD